ncbi:MAG: Holliday junction branch migration protein RuvA [Alphaproteobacteria bacterium]|nr:Holliday junction branch migration protein RuvA [Alphaproteobacteria bacterium]MBP7757635.1 Holliday junction branch migration protein RuvA [Alphaproteobacteria bacterium]MBP7761165.1 Holliday junction branch migration protein RuvA [Alphaproteobacteria bacterium]MBP7905152.1 Holliday junction branch migration protein RuvA [Alphaproteobacteria bacterium]
MIGKLSGVIDSFGKDHLILDVGGVGYLVQASGRTLSRIGLAGDPAALLIITQVREDAITLFGFAEAAEREWFRLLTSVQGVGAKVAMAILSVCPPDRLGFVIASQDKAVLTQADGVGPKLAARLLTELKDKAGKVELSPESVSRTKVSGGEVTGDNVVDQDAVSALTNLGYARTEAFAAVMVAKSKANDNEQGNLQSLIRLALKELSA